MEERRASGQNKKGVGPGNIFKAGGSRRREGKACWDPMQPALRSGAERDRETKRTLETMS